LILRSLIRNDGAFFVFGIVGFVLGALLFCFFTLQSGFALLGDFISFACAKETEAKKSTP